VYRKPRFLIHEAVTLKGLCGLQFRVNGSNGGGAYLAEESPSMATTDAAAQPTSSQGGLLVHHPLVFFLTAYTGSWLAWLPLVLSEDGTGLLPFSSPLTHPLIGGGSLLQIVGVFLGPFLAAFIMTGTTEGRLGIRRLLRRVVLWRVGLRWYLFVFIAPPVVAVLVTIVLPGALASFQTPDPLSVWPISASLFWY